MAICGKCGGTIDDSSAQSDVEGGLLCKACAGAGPHGSARTAGRSQAGVSVRARSSGSAGVWKALALVGCGAALVLIMVTFSLVSSRSKLRVQNTTLLADKGKLQQDCDAVRQELGNVRDALADKDRLLGRRETELRQARQRIAALETEIQSLKQPAPEPTPMPPPKPGQKPEPPAAKGPTAGSQPSSGANLFTWKTDATRYHLAGCRLLKNHEHVPVTMAEARQRKLTACPICKPPTK